MKISTKGRYGLRLILDIAKNQINGPVMLKDVAKRQKISLKYLGNIVPLLKNANLIASKKGFRGGFVLLKNTDKITLLEIITALEGNVFFAECVDSPKKCDRWQNCIARNLWSSMASKAKNMMRSITLQDILEKYSTKNFGLYYTI